ncbi:MAG: response regulator [bacterium]
MATLLIVDDDNLVRDTLHDLLSTAHECHTADRAEQALAYLGIETYDAVLTDINMPGLSGRDLLRYIQAKHSATPVIVIAGMAEEYDAGEMIAAGAFAYFAKPFKLDEIEAAVDRAIARHRELTNTDGDAGRGSPEDSNQAETETGAPDVEPSN